MKPPIDEGGPAGSNGTALIERESLTLPAKGRARRSPGSPAQALGPEAGPALALSGSKPPCFTPSVGRAYTLEKAAPQASGHARPKPPRPKPGERGALAYSSRDLKALYATAHALDWQCLVTLTGPATAPIDNWPRLRGLIRTLKRTLTNWRRRKGFPRVLFVVEFTPPVPGEVATAHFHLGFELPLDDAQQAALCDFWLKLSGGTNNRGRLFDCKASGGGPRLAAYLAKDIKGKFYVKYPAAWLPLRLEVRLWFVVGLARRPARQGAALLASKAIRRRQFDLLPWYRSEARRLPEAMPGLASDSEHASAYITTVSAGLDSILCFRAKQGHGYQDRKMPSVEGDGGKP